MSAVVLLTMVAVAAVLLLLVSQTRWPQNDDDVVSAVNRLLPQTQCAQCGYPGCRPYAKAIAEGEPINLCPPGGDQTVQAIATLLGREVIPLATAVPEPVVAFIREPECIGCTLCIQVCPVDAILGAQQQMHTVIADRCTGCELCVPACPVDCIDLLSTPAPPILSKPDVTTPCIHCGECVPVCPRQLAPQQLLLLADLPEAAAELRLSDCVECGRCDRACPSQIPLTRTFRFMKAMANDSARRRELAIRAEQQFALHELRTTKQQSRVQQRPAEQADDLLASIARDISE